MALTIEYTPGYVWTVGELITEDKLNLAANPLINLFGSISTASIADGSVTTAKLAVGVLSADAPGQALMASGYFTADSAGRSKFASGFMAGDLMDDGTRLGVPQYAAGVFALNVYAVTLSPAAAAYAEGQTIRFKADTANAGACSVNVNALGPKAIKKNVNQDPVPGDILAGEVAVLTYDGTNFQLGGRHAGAAVLGSAKNLGCKVNASTPLSKADITADELVLKDSNGNAWLAAAVSVTADVTVSGANGLDTGSEGASTWYYLWAIWNPTTNTVAALLSASGTTPTLPSGYTFKALAGVVYNDGSSNFTAFWQQDQTVWVNTAEVGGALLAGKSSYGSVSLAALVPPNAKSVFGCAGAGLNTGVMSQIAIAGDANGLGATQVITDIPSGTSFDAMLTAGRFECPMPTAQTIYYKTPDTTSSKYIIRVSGYRL
jgi:hypothetical protein